MVANSRWPSPPRLHKREYRALGKVFAAEIENTGIPYQYQARVYRELAEMDYIKETSVKIGCRFPETIIGWILTERGRITYCEWAAARGATQ